MARAESGEVSEAPEFSVPRGAVNVQHDDETGQESFELPPVIEDWGDVDWSESWDDLIDYDDVGSEEEDSYGEETN